MSEKKQKSVTEPQPFVSYAHFREAAAEDTAMMRGLLLRIERDSVGQPVPSRYRIIGPTEWRLYWDLAPELTVTVFRVNSEKDNYFLVHVNGEIFCAALSPEEFEKALFKDILVRPLKVYKRAQWFKDKLSDLAPYLQWSKCWGCVWIGTALTVYVYDEGEVTLSHRIGGVNSMGMYLQGKESIQMAASVVRGYIGEWLIKKKD